MIAGRSSVAAAELAAQIRHDHPGAAVDAVEVTLPDGLQRCLDRAAPAVVINSYGPFQGQDYAVAEACIARGVHYIDLADGREFVCGIDSLDEAARRAGVLVASGASSVPGLSGCVIDHLRAGLRRVDSIEIGISPGNRAPRGLAVVAAIMSYVGKPIRVWRGGKWDRGHGWQGLYRRALSAPPAADLPPRWFSLCEVPDLDLFPRRYPEVTSVSFGAGLEFSPLHLGLWLLSWVVRGGVIRDLARHAGRLHSLADRLAPFGSDRGGMYVELQGIDPDGRKLTRRWTLIAGSGHGPWIPVMPAVVLARRLARGWRGAVGATSCLGLFTLDEFAGMTAGFDIHTAIADVHD